MMTTVKIAVIGVGVQGQRHAAKLATLERAQLVGVADIDVERCNAVANEFGTECVPDYHDLLGAVDAVAIATPTPTHFDITREFLENGVHVLLEKPIAATMEEARGLVELAERKGLVFQIGHLERFNPAVLAMADFIDRPQFIESNRIAPYRPRALDVSVVLDLMIHDIDLVHSFVQSPMKNVDAIGRRVFSDNIDIANARIRFESGCVANVTSSRISMKTERSLRVFQSDSYVSADLQSKTVTSYRKRGSSPVTGPDDVRIDAQSFGNSDALLDQALAFVEAVAGGPPPLVSGRTGMQALETAMIIADLVAQDSG
jgi:predicted dehydrogenase